MPTRFVSSIAVAVALLTVTPALVRAANVETEDWNDEKVKWVSYDDGLAQAKKDKKPICLIFYTEWCPHCKNFSRVFFDEGVVRLSKDFVMVRVDKDKHPDISKKYAPDGEYIPRTYFLGSDGTLAADIHAPRPTYQYFYDEHRAMPLIVAMRSAKEKLK